MEIRWKVALPSRSRKTNQPENEPKRKIKTKEKNDFEPIIIRSEKRGGVMKKAKRRASSLKRKRRAKSKIDILGRTKWTLLSKQLNLADRKQTENLKTELSYPS